LQTSTQSPDWKQPAKKLCPTRLNPSFKKRQKPFFLPVRTKKPWSNRLKHQMILQNTDLPVVRITTGGYDYDK